MPDLPCKLGQNRDTVQHKSQENPARGAAIFIQRIFMPHATRLSSFATGARDTIPMLVGAAPFDIIFGSLVGANQLAA